MRAREFIDEGPVWDKIKNTATAGAVAGSLGYGALTGQFKDIPWDQQPDPARTTVVQKNLKPGEPSVPQVTPEKPTTSSTATNADPKMEKLVFLSAYRAGLTGQELAQFMGQVAHETLGFQKMTEVGSKEYFNRYDPKHSPKKAKILGNVKPGDGARYKGRGFLQITGRDNYRRAGQALGLPLEKNPDLASDPKVAAQIAVWFWKNRVRPEVQDFSDTIAVTSKINPSMNGLGDRDLNFHNYAYRLKKLINKSS